jgi:medium-chain acyl-[acyl-carrier-protein] hydrolase
VSAPGTDVVRSAWLATLGQRPDAPFRLVALPYAGGSCTIFRRWHRLLDEVDVWAVQLPGRGSRHGERPHRSLDELVAALCDSLAGDLDKPYALFGHCMGGLLGFEVVRELRARGARVPACLVVAARRAPQVPLSGTPVSSLPEYEFLDRLRAMDGTPREVLDNADLLRLMSPTIRADFRMCETYRYRVEPPLACPIRVLGGTLDEPTEAELAAWGQQTTAGCSVHMVEGPHFFIHSAEDVVVAHVRDEIDEGGHRWDG